MMMMLQKVGHKAIKSKKDAHIQKKSAKIVCAHNTKMVAHYEQKNTKEMNG